MMGAIGTLNFMVAFGAFCYYHADANELIWYESAKGKKKLAIRMKEIFCIARAVILFDVALLGFIALDAWIYHTVFH